MTDTSVLAHPSGPAPFGDSNRALVARAMADLVAGRPVMIAQGPYRQWILAVDCLDDTRLAGFHMLCGEASPVLLVTEQRAQVLGVAVDQPIALEVAVDADTQALMALASAEKVAGPVRVVDDTAPAALSLAAVELAKIAQLLPALVASPPERLGALPMRLALSTAPAVLGEAGAVVVEAEAVLRFRADTAASIRRVSDARIPIRDDIDARFITFRDDSGGLALAIMIGAPDLARPLPLRIHSACLTGDIFGSRRCDCGDQLWLAVHRVHELGGGCVLYLDQEGRGLGLVNKLRTYALQDRGLDTVDANTALGYHEDERDYVVAGRMLAQLGVSAVSLLTNNPLKISALLAAGIEVVDRVPVLAEVQDANRRYMETKAARSGHWLDQINPAAS